MKEMYSKLKEMNNLEVPQHVQQDKIETIASQYLAEFDSIVKNVEEFALLATTEDLDLGSDFIIRFAGDLVSISEKSLPGKIVKFAQGAPSMIGCRLLILCGALALELDNYEYASAFVREPIEIEDNNGKFSHMPLYQRRRLFYPEVFLGYANYPMHYLANYWNQYDYLQEYFSDIETYQRSITKFLVLVALATTTKIGYEKDRPLYPGYRLIPQAKQAINQLCGKMYHSEKFRMNIASVIGDTSENLLNTWEKRAKYLNEAGLGSSYWDSLRLPIPMNAEVEDW
ncbi:MAG: hypothetical protein JW712_04455 [Dehalococcoidales bacterium]|nr:hypothetical protein [Dehalococcoidales bacterium]